MEKFRGCYPHKNSGWTATIGKNGKSLYLGWFRTLEEAKAARLNAEIEHFGAVFDRREIEVDAEQAKIPLHGRGGKFYGYALVDLEDLDLVSQVAWTIDTNGYVVGRPSGHANSIAMHRLIMRSIASTQSFTDHKDGNKLDNRRKNLRPCTPKENARNTRLSKNNTSGFKGVRRTENGTWNARITVNRKEIHLGNYKSKEEAAAAYDAAAKIHHLEFASPNEPRVELAISQYIDARYAPSL